MTNGSRGEAGHSPCLSVSAKEWESNSVCVCVFVHLDWTGQKRLIVCDMGQEGVGCGSRADGDSLSRGESSTQSQRVPICMCVPFVCMFYCVCVCLCILTHYPSPE